MGEPGGQSGRVALIRRVRLTGDQPVVHKKCSMSGAGGKFGHETDLQVRSAGRVPGG
jgi:hypothetical protein